MTSIPNNKVWNKLGFWQYDCGCVQYQDGWDYCSAHKGKGYISVLKGE